jgi:transposase InsO family protein
VPYRVHAVLTDNGVPFSDQARTGERLLTRPFARLCRVHGIEHGPTKPYHPWTNGQAERMVGTVKGAAVHTFHHGSVQELRRHVTDWLAAYNFARQHRWSRWRTPLEVIAAVRRRKPEIFLRSPVHLTPGPCIWRGRRCW